MAGLTCPSPVAAPRCAIRRRTASMSVTTSSITTHTAAARPSSVTVVNVVPRRYRTYAASTSATGTTTMPINAVRHEANTASARASSARPMSAAQPMFLSAVSTKVAGRYSRVSTVMPFRPGAMSAIACSMSLVTWSVSAPGNFSITRRRLGAEPATASPIRG